MRDVTITRSDNGKTHKTVIRKKKKKEIKKLKSCGYSILGCMPTYAQSDDAVDKGLAQVFNKETLAFIEECDAKETKRVWSELLKETYGEKEEEKNSGNTTDGTTTEKE